MAEDRVLAGVDRRSLAIEYCRSTALVWLLPSPGMKRRIWPALLGLAYIAVNYLLGGLNHDHTVIGSLALLDSYNPRTREFLKYFFPFLLVAILYDSMRYFYWWGITGRIHVTEHYEFDKLLFGIVDEGILRSAPEYFDKHTSVILDLICGFAYLVFVLEYLAAALLLFFRRQFALLAQFGIAFVSVNVIGFVTYFIYPAAPPWYLTLYGFGPAREGISSNAAAAIRFDAFFGTHFFDQLYGRGIDVFGSIPSLHVAYPLLVAWVSWKIRKWLFAPAFLFYVLMCFSAVYLQHHHVVDIILGTAYAILAIPISRDIMGALKTLKYSSNFHTP